ncbi:MAG: CDP-alcohol phosphatidyltransferase family protein [Nocardioidaceae bacterium]|nr:CDP-alcohol phosphatidyltransferase family protein [Nocardioidaceae bacterium]
MNRPLGRQVTALMHPLGATPNQATVVSATLTGTAIVLLASCRPAPWLAVAVPLLLAAGYVMDSVDGQLSRLRGGGSLSGEWLDHMVDATKTVTLHSAVLVSWYRFPVSDSDALLLVPLAFQAAAVVTFFGMLLLPSLRAKSAAAGRAASTEVGPEHPLRRFLLLPIDYGTVCLSFVLVAWSTGFLVLYVVLFVAQAGALAAALLSWWRELQQLDAVA